MKKQLVAFVFLFLLLGSIYAQNIPVTTSAPSGTTSSSTSQPYCTDLFTNSNSLVSNALYNPSTYGNLNIPGSLMAISFLIIMAVLLTISLVYGIGIGFGIDSFVRFARSEYLESFFNIIILLLIIGGIVFANWLPTFFNDITSVSLPAAAALPTTTAGSTNSVSAGVYTAICNNIISNQVIPSLGVFVLSTTIENTYKAVASLSIVIIPPTFLPSFSIKPFSGLSANLAFVSEQVGVIFVVLGIDASVIFLLFIIYFLFPIYLYLGIVLRSFPWTRAAGGTFIAIFIAFYIVFPAILYPFTTATRSTSTGSGLCQTGASSGTNYCLTPVTSLSSFITTAFSVLNNQGGGTVSGGASTLIQSFGLTGTIAIYTAAIAFFVETLAGIFIAYLVSYELLEMLGDVLGAPSLNANSLIRGII